MDDIVREQGISIWEAIENIGPDSFRRTLRFTNKYGTIKFSGYKAFGSPIYRESTSKTILEWMKLNSDNAIRREFFTMMVYQMALARLH